MTERPPDKSASPQDKNRAADTATACPKRHKQTFIHGAAILIAANAIAKVIGALFRIPLTRVLKPEGIALYNAAYDIYKVFFVIMCTGLPIALSKMIAQTDASDDKYQTQKIFNAGLYVLTALGIIGFLLMFFGANFFADAIRNPDAYYAILSMSPAVFFVAVISVYKGYFQGLQNMTPTAISQIVESFVKLVAGFALAYLFMKKGVRLAAVGAGAGVSFGAILSALSLAVFYIIYRKTQKPYHEATNPNNTKDFATTKKYIIKLIKIAVPITLGSAVFTLTSAIDTAMIMRRLQDGGFSYLQAKQMYGALSGYAVVMFSFPPALVVAMATSIVPAVASAYAVKDYQSASQNTLAALRITAAFALPCTVGFLILPEGILQLVFNDAASKISLAMLSFAVTTVSLVLITNALIQSAGNVFIPVINMLIGGLIKIGVNYLLVGNPSVNIIGAPVGTNLCYLAIMLLNFIYLRKITGVKIFSFFLKPLAAAAVMGIALFFLQYVVCAGFSNIKPVTIISIIAGGFVYGVVLILIKGIHKQDIALIPKGDKIIKLLKL